MTVVVITPPSPIVTLAEAKRQMGIDDCNTDSDALLDFMIHAVQAQMEPTSSYLGRSFGLQVLEMRLDESTWWTDCNTGWPPAIPLPYPPLALDDDTGAPLVDSVKYLDTSNVLQTLAADQWRVVGAGSQGIAKIGLAYNKSWPSTLSDPEAIRVRWTAGYAANDLQMARAKAFLLLSLQEMKSLAREDLFLSREDVPGVGSQSWNLSADATAAVRKAIDSLGIGLWIPVL